MNNPFDYVPSAACGEAFRKLLERIESLRMSDDVRDINFCRELDEGKMLGVLIAADNAGTEHSLYAFSGQLGDGGFCYPGFVGPVFDYLQPDGYFKTREREISGINAEIAEFEKGYLRIVTEEYNSVKDKLRESVDEYKEKCRLSKLERKNRRAEGFVTADEEAAMIRESQFEKAELHRMKKRVSEALMPYEERLNDAVDKLEKLKEKRRKDSEALQQWLFYNFKVLNGRGESKSLSDIFAETAAKIPPSGAGECCAPKLLQAAYQQGLKPLSIAEYWYGKPKDGEVRIHGSHYPACRGKCLPVLNWMLRGIDVTPPLDYSKSNKIYTPGIVFENEWFCILNKPSGMLSVRGKSSEISLQQWLEERYGTDKEVKVAHRLDQDTSGLIVATFGTTAFKYLQALFATRKVSKTYIADLEGDYRSKGISRQGFITLPLSPDWLDRPRQRVDYEGGKEAITEYEFTEVIEGRSRVIFHPHTGRTHQLRVHAAAAAGLDMPIVGDRLYGKGTGHFGKDDRSSFKETGHFGKDDRLNFKGDSRENNRLLLHAGKIEFVFPLDGKHYSFEVPVPF